MRYVVQQALLEKLKNPHIFNLFQQNIDNNHGDMPLIVNSRPALLDQLLANIPFVNGTLQLNPTILTSQQIINVMRLLDMPDISKPPTAIADQQSWNLEQFNKINRDPAHYASLCISILSDLEYQHQLQASINYYNQLPTFEEQQQNQTQTYASIASTTINDSVLFPLIMIDNKVNIDFAKLVPSQLATALNAKIAGKNLQQQKRWLSAQSVKAQQDSTTLSFMVLRIRQQQQQGFQFTHYNEIMQQQQHMDQVSSLCTIPTIEVNSIIISNISTSTLGNTDLLFLVLQCITKQLNLIVDPITLHTIATNPQQILGIDTILSGPPRSYSLIIPLIPPSRADKFTFVATGPTTKFLSSIGLSFKDHQPSTKYGITLSNDTADTLTYSTQIMVIRTITFSMAEITYNMLLPIIGPNNRMILHASWTRYAALQDSCQYIHRHAYEPVIIILSLQALSNVHISLVRRQITSTPISTSHSTSYKLGPLQLEIWPTLEHIHGHPLTPPGHINALHLQHINTQSIATILSVAAQLVSPVMIDLAFITSSSSCCLLLNTPFDNNAVTIPQLPLQQLELPTRMKPQATYVNAYPGTDTMVAFQYNSDNTCKLNQRGVYHTVRMTGSDNYQEVLPSRMSTRRRPPRQQQLSNRQVSERKSQQLLQHITSPIEHHMEVEVGTHTSSATIHPKPPTSPLFIWADDVSDDDDCDNNNTSNNNTNSNNNNNSNNINNSNTSNTTNNAATSASTTFTTLDTSTPTVITPTNNFVTIQQFSTLSTQVDALAASTTNVMNALLQLVQKIDTQQQSPAFNCPPSNL